VPPSRCEVWCHRVMSCRDRFMGPQDSLEDGLTGGPRPLPCALGAASAAAAGDGCGCGCCRVLAPDCCSGDVLAVPSASGEKPSQPSQGMPTPCPACCDASRAAGTVSKDCSCCCWGCCRWNSSSSSCCPDCVVPCCVVTADSVCRSRACPRFDLESGRSPLLLLCGTLCRRLVLWLLDLICW